MRINWKFLSTVVIVLVVLGVTAWVLRTWLRSQRIAAGLQAGAAAYDAGQWEQAAQGLGKYIVAHPNDVQVLLKYANAHLNMRPVKLYSIEQAAAAYRNVLRLEGDNPEAAQKLIATYLAMDMASEAQAIALNRLAVVEDPETRMMLGVAYAAQRRFAQAKEELTAVVENHPEMVAAYEYLAAVLDAIGPSGSGDARQCLDDCVKKNPDSKLARIIRADFALSKYDIEGAVADLSDADKMDMADDRVHLRLARSWLAAGRPQIARKYAEELVRVSPTDPDVWEFYAVLADSTGDKELMVEVAERGLKNLGEDYPGFSISAAELYIKANEIERGLACIANLEKSQIDPAGVLFVQGLAADRKGDAYQAIRYWRQSLAARGNYGIQAHLGIALAFARIDDIGSAIRQLRGAVLQYPDSYDIRLGYSRLLGLAGRADGAAEQARVALRLNPNGVEAARQLLDAQIGMVSEKSQDSEIRGIRAQLASLSGQMDVSAVRLLECELETRLGNFTRATSLIESLGDVPSGGIDIDLKKAELLAAQGHHEKAIAGLTELLGRDPSNRDALELLVKLHLDKGRGAECDGWIQDAMKQVDSPGDKVGLVFLQAMAYQRSDRAELAGKVLSDLADEYPDDVQTKRRLLSIPHVFYDHDQAQRLVDGIRRVEGDDGWQWRYEQARLWVFGSRKGQAIQAVKLLKDSLRGNPDDLSLQLLLGAAYEYGDQDHLALNTYLEILAAHPDEPRAALSAAKALYTAGSYDRANQILARLDANELADPVFARLRMRSYLDRDDLGGAAAIVESMLAGDPDDMGMRLTLAQIKTRQGDLAGAGAVLEGIRKENPDSIEALAGLVNIKVAEKDQEGAIALCDLYVAERKSPEGHILRARTYSLFGMHDEARRDVDVAVGMAPDNAVIWMTASQILSLAGQTAQACDAAEKAVAVDPLNIDVRKRAVELFAGSSNPVLVRKGNEILDSLLAANADDLELRFMKARSLAVAGTRPAITEAATILDKIVAERPGIEGVYVLLARLWVARNDTEKALDTISLGLAFSPQSRALLTLKAGIEMDISASRALPTLKTLYEIDPCDTNVVLQLSDAYWRAAKTDIAADMLRRHIGTAVSKDKLRLGRQLVGILVKENRVDAAQKVIDMYGGDEPSRSLIQAYLLMARKDWPAMSSLFDQWRQRDDHASLGSIASELAGVEDAAAARLAETTLGEVVKKDPGNSDAAMSLAMLYQRTGRYQMARQMYDKVLAISPENLVAINNLAWLLCENLGEPAAALAMAQRGLDIMPSYIDLVDTRGMAYYRSGKIGQAYSDFKTCVEMYAGNSPALPATYLHLAMACQGLGLSDEVLESVAKARQADRSLRVLSPAEHKELDSLESAAAAGKRR